MLLSGRLPWSAISDSVTLRVGSELDPIWVLFRPVARPDLKPLSIKGIYLDSREALPLVPVSAGYHCSIQRTCPAV